MKKLIFNLLPESLKRKIILNKTGSLKVKANVSKNVHFDIFIVPNSELWKKRLSTHYGHEAAITKFYENYLNSNDIIFDIGAQMGYFPSLISTLNKDALIYAFEANWYTFHFLKLNKNLNDTNNKWHLFNYFISDKDANLKNEKYYKIDSIIDRLNKIPTIFQMDVDGEEYRIMSGAQKLIGNNITEFLIEVHPKDLKERKIKTTEFLSLFDSKLYDFHYLPDLRNDNSNWTSDISKVDLNEEFYLYAFPKNKSRIHETKSLL
jgi:hypothetical protein